MKFRKYYKESLKIKKIYVDMDGVLVWWDKAFEDISGGINAREYERIHGKNSYWPLIAKKGVDFWANAEWMPDGKKLWNFIKKYDPTILTSPTRDKEGHKFCIDGKKRWLKRELPGVPYIIDHEKHKYANENSILIDDYSSKIKLWKEAGGIPIHHKDAESTINKLREIGFK